MGAHRRRCRWRYAKLIEFLKIFVLKPLEEVHADGVYQANGLLSASECGIQEEAAEGDMCKIKSFLDEFHERPKEEQAEGDIEKLVEFLSAFEDTVWEESAEGDTHTVWEES